MLLLRNVLGILVLVLGLYIFSKDKKQIKWKVMIKAFIIQFVIAFALIKFPLGQKLLQIMSDGVSKVLAYGADGLAFIFGTLSDGAAPTGMIFGIQILGNIIFVSAIIGALYYLGVIGFVVKIIGGAIGKVLGTSKAESFVAVANVFLGHTDAPLLVAKYIGKMTESEVMLVLVSGMGSVSASIIGGYVAMGIPAEALLIAGAMVPVGSIIVSKMLMPEVEEVQEADNVEANGKGENENLICAISNGACSGAQVVINVSAVLIAMMAIVAMLNGLLSMFGVSIESILSVVFWPVGWLMGVEPQNISLAAELLGSKIALNEFVSFAALGEVISSLDYRTGMMMSISLCGFANLASIAICVAGIGSYAPERKGLLARLGFKSMFAGCAVSLLSAMIVGLLLLF
ncbi:MAG: NupC/NupG family nucleoside CNT transporter [Sarcina sp.]